jgi:hypothetical protein
MIPRFHNFFDSFPMGVFGKVSALIWVPFWYGRQRHRHASFILNATAMPLSFSLMFHLFDSSAQVVHPV